jgi:hypothetical protein
LGGWLTQEQRASLQSQYEALVQSYEPRAIAFKRNGFYAPDDLIPIRLLKVSQAANVNVTDLRFTADPCVPYMNFSDNNRVMQHIGRTLRTLRITINEEHFLETSSPSERPRWSFENVLRSMEHLEDLAFK